jgi:hypothetical protein
MINLQFLESHKCTIQHYIPYKYGCDNANKVSIVFGLAMLVFLEKPY